ncbi:MAG: thioredoxin family protein [Alphaproteobacteria bacterium]|nr:thioredoxin family protein [Alphaproteobacteria bacterium]
MLMKSLILSALAFVAITTATPAQAAIEIGKPAPEFTATDTNGKTHKLSDFKGKNVVLEWTNPGCPFVIKHYDVGNMQKLQEKYTAEGVIWLSINSSAAGKEGNMTPEESNKYITEQKSKETARIIDADGTIGKLYDAKTTPHMFVIDKDGNVAYMGAIDSDSSFKSEKIEGATNYVSAALDALLADKPVETTSTKPYGCSVKY